MNVQQLRQRLGARLSILVADADIDFALFGFVFAHGCCFAVLLLCKFIQYV